MTQEDESASVVSSASDVEVSRNSDSESELGMTNGEDSQSSSSSARSSDSFALPGEKANKPSENVNTKASHAKQTNPE